MGELEQSIVLEDEVIVEEVEASELADPIEEDLTEEVVNEDAEEEEEAEEAEEAEEVEEDEDEELEIEDDVETEDDLI